VEHGDVSETELGFAGARVPVGTHICQIFSDDAERSSAMLKFLHKGLVLREMTACFSEKLDEDCLQDLLRGNGLDLVALKAERTYQKAGARDVYFADGRFEPDRMLGLLTAFHQESHREGYVAARVIGEMEPDIRSVPGGDRLLEYEARVSVLLRQHPVTAMCQYDARLFDGATILDVLRVHPMMVVRDMVVRNPFFVQPEEVLAPHRS
jgi:hypothetical protein